jgi:cell wall-active antibiotic response 4TMS protein YvqF
MRDNDISLIRAVRGPITLITVGVLFALNNFTDYRFHQTWPVLLIVFGLLSLVRRGIEPVAPPPAPGYAPPPYNYPPPPPSSGSFRQSTYNEPPAPSSEPVKGGFGSTSSAQRPGETEERRGDAV